MIGQTVRNLRYGLASANFDPVARIYRWAEYLALGPLLRRTREALLPDLAGTRRALVLGDGDGRFTALLLCRMPGLHVTAVDTSVRMLALMSSRCGLQGDSHRLQVLHRSALEHHADSDTDLVVTHFFLDCLEQEDVNRLAKGLAAEVSADCCWLISEFGVPARGRGRSFARIYIRTLYLSFRLLTGLQPQHLPDYGSALRAAGWSALKRQERLGGLLRSELWRLERPCAEPHTPGTT